MGRAMLREDGRFNPPPASAEDLIDDARAVLASPVAEFVADRCELDPAETTERSRLCGKPGKSGPKRTVIRAGTVVCSAGTFAPPLATRSRTCGRGTVRTRRRLYKGITLKPVNF